MNQILIVLISYITFVGMGYCENAPSQTAKESRIRTEFLKLPDVNRVIPLLLSQ